MDLLSSRRRLAASAAAVLVIIAAVAVIIFLQPATAPDQDHEGHEVAGGTASASVSPTAEATNQPSDSGNPAEPSARVVESPPTAGVEHPGQPEPDQPGSQQGTSLSEAAAEPDRRRGSEDLGTPRDPVDPTEVIGDGTSLGGCLAEYGENGQCLPVIPPSMGEHAAEMAEQGLDPRSMHHPWSCAEVRTHFPDGIAVRNTDVDPQSLDGNGDGTACGAGD